MENQNLEQNGEIKLAEPKRFDQCEWCYQFDGDAPQVFAWTDEENETNELPEVKFTLSNIDGAYIQFTDKETGKSFKLFARELSEKGKEMRNFQKEAYAQMINSKTEENASENKEA